MLSRLLFYSEKYRQINGVLAHSVYITHTIVVGVYSRYICIVGIYSICILYIAVC